MKREFLYLLGLFAFAFVFSIVWAVVRTPDTVDSGLIVNQEPVQRPPFNDAAVEAFRPLLTSGSGVARVAVDGRTMDLHMHEAVSRSAGQEIAGSVAQRFSQFRQSYEGLSGVTVRVLYDGLIMAEADARNTQITAVR